MTSHIHYIDGDGATATAEFPTSSEAWAFMRLCQSQNVAVGFPALPNCTVCGR